MMWIAQWGLLFILFPCIASAGDCSPRCSFGNWYSWDSCSRPCGGGLKLRKRTICCAKYQSINICLLYCGAKSADLSDVRNCNEDCRNGGTHTRSGCVCGQGFFGYCCQLEDSNRTFSSSCSWSSWESWGPCASSDGSRNGVHSHQREPVCARNETRTACMTRCGYSDKAHGAWEEKPCQVPYNRNSGPALVQQWISLITAYILVNM